MEIEFDGHPEAVKCKHCKGRGYLFLDSPAVDLMNITDDEIYEQIVDIETEFCHSCEGLGHIIIDPEFEDDFD